MDALNVTAAQQIYLLASSSMIVESVTTASVLSVLMILNVREQPRQTVGSQTSLYASGTSESSENGAEETESESRDDNPLDIVYEIVAEQSCRKEVQENAGWVSVAVCSELAFHRGLEPIEIFENIEHWVSLGVMTVHADGTKIRFQGPFSEPLHPSFLRQKETKEQ